MTRPTLAATPDAEALVRLALAAAAEAILGADEGADTIAASVTAEQIIAAICHVDAERAEALIDAAIDAVTP